MDSSAYY